jgi:hypothetical protein
MGFVGSAPAVRELVNASGPGGSLKARLGVFVNSFLLAIFIAACGGSNTGPSDPPPPPPANAQPVVTSILVKGTLPREPAQYATLGETVNITASVTDAETPVSQLTYAWSSSVGGTFSANAATTTWTAPATLSGTTPLNATLTLTVTERIDATRNNVVTSTTIVDLHDSAREVGDLARLFLEDFSKQLAPDVVMRNFTNNCPTTAEERQDVINQQAAVQVMSYEIGPASTTVPFSGACPFRNRAGDACSSIPVRWVSRIKSTGAISNSSGIDQVTAVLENGQWKLCASDYNQLTSSGASLLRYWIER